MDFHIGMNDETYQKFGHPNVFDEAIFDAFNLNIPQLFVKGLSLKIGRQDLFRGEGFILAEGTPGDGSRTMYFNAAVLAYTFRKSKIEAIGILDPKEDRFLPRLNDQRKCFLDSDEQALALYYTDRNRPKTAWESYFLHKKEVHNRLAPTNPQYQPDRRVETLGGRVVQQLSKRWSVTAEGAAQWGNERPVRPIRAWAAYGYAKRQSDTRRKPYVLAGFWALSGDDPARRDRVSGWDPLFSRWPKWGDLDLYSEFTEKGVGYATNQTRWQLEAGFSPARRATWRFTYYREGAFHPYTRNPAVYGTGTSRGNAYQTRLDFVLNDHLRGHVDLEALRPGDFAVHGGQVYFLRFEMLAEARATVRNFNRRFLPH
jgi:hypothetical protein